MVTDEMEPAGVEKPNTVIPSQANGTQHNRIMPVKVEVDLDKPRQHVITGKLATKPFNLSRALALQISSCLSSLSLISILVFSSYRS